MVHERIGRNILAEEFSVDFNGLHPASQVFIMSEIIKSRVPRWKEAQAFNIVRLYINGFLLVFGFLSNLFCLILLQTGKLKSNRGRVVLTALTLVAVLFILCVLLPVYIGHVSGYFWMDGLVNCKIYSYLQGFFLFLIPWLTVFVTLERAFAVRFPFKVQLLTNRRRLIALICLFLILAGLCLYVPIITKISDIEGYGDDSTVFNMYVIHRLGYISRCAIQTTESQMANSLIQPIIVPVFNFALPLSLILVGNIIILYEIKTGANKLLAHINDDVKLKKTKERLQRERAVTVTVLIAGSTFLVLMVPGTVYNIILRFFPDEFHAWISGYVSFRKQILLQLLQEITWTCYYLNSCMNFIIYLLIGSEFRGQCMTVFRMLMRCNRQSPRPLR